jgi:hypothetical protein
LIELRHDGLSRPLESPKLRVLSLGAGVQSSTVAIMAARGDLGAMPDCAIFADTGAEPQGVYDYLDYLVGILPFPVHIVSSGNLRTQLVTPGQKTNGRPPMFIRNRDGSIGMTRRQCTGDFKIDPIMKKVRELIGLQRGQHGPKSPVVEQWIGISTDEIVRVKRARLRFVHNRHPLIEARMSRQACLGYLTERQYRLPPKSACTFCPFHSDTMWRDMKENDPASFEDACIVDQALRDNQTVGIGIPYLHRSCRPLREIDFSNAEDRGQGALGFTVECEGMCGV